MRPSQPALKPVLRLQATLDMHWGKHHRTYVTNLNGQVEGTDMESKSLEEVRALCTVPYPHSGCCMLESTHRLRSFCGLLYAGVEHRLRSAVVCCSQVVQQTWNNGSPTAAFNNAAQAWNHEFYWESMSPKPVGACVLAARFLLVPRRQQMVPGHTPCI
jgi:superoxide dismutase, Fe-Mn family